MRFILEQIEKMNEADETGYDLFRGRLVSLFANPTSSNAKEFISWAKNNFSVDMIPRGQKQEAMKIRTVMEYVDMIASGGSFPNGYGFLLRSFDNVDKDVFNKFFVKGGEKAKDVLYKGKYATYRNMVGFPSKKLKSVADMLDSVFGELSGWRKKVLNNLVVGLAGPSDFRGTSAGKYGVKDDVLYVRATPKVLARPAKTYGSPDYILIHELGHRYQHLYGSFKMYDLVKWFTTPYSMTSDDEAFAELFALGHFGIKKAHREWDPKIQEEFEGRMGKGE